MEGYLHSYESLATLDGDGLRFAVFLAGCPLRCVYCHNPDTWLRGERCVDAAELIKKIVRYKPYFSENGGVTFSGGEPLLQAEFLEEMIPLLQEEKIPYVLDTSGAVPLTERVKKVLRNAESVLLDLKFWDDASYRKFTLGSMDLPMQILSYLNEIGKETVIRTVIVPEINDNEEALMRYADRIKGVSCVKRYELLPFHTMGFFKYEKLGFENPLAQSKGLSKERCNALQAFLDEYRKKNG